MVAPPYLRVPPSSAKKLTLVLDLDETLLHYMEVQPGASQDQAALDQAGSLFIRPGADDFLGILSQHYELVIFTAAMQDYADWAISHFKNADCITHRLYR
jgi:CTD small phosphatase-like protein 2